MNPTQSHPWSSRAKETYFRSEVKRLRISLPKLLEDFRELGGTHEALNELQEDMAIRLADVMRVAKMPLPRLRLYGKLRLEPFLK